MNEEQIKTDVPLELVPKVQELVNVAFSQGPEQAIEQARKDGPALVDAVHAALSKPEVHEELLKRGKISPAA